MIQSPLDNLFLNFTDSDNISDDEEEEIIMMLDNANIIAVEDEILLYFLMVETSCYQNVQFFWEGLKENVCCFQYLVWNAK